jgi:hypothetical protein
LHGVLEALIMTAAAERTRCGKGSPTIGIPDWQVDGRESICLAGAGMDGRTHAACWFGCYCRGDDSFAGGRRGGQRLEAGTTGAGNIHDGDD